MPAGEEGRSCFRPSVAMDMGGESFGAYSGRGTRAARRTCELFVPAVKDLIVVRGAILPHASSGRRGGHRRCGPGRAACHGARARSGWWSCTRWSAARAAPGAGRPFAAAVLREHEVSADVVRFAPALPKTSSGKVRRGACGTLLQAVLYSSGGGGSSPEQGGGQGGGSSSVLPRPRSSESIRHPGPEAPYRSIRCGLELKTLERDAELASP